jgi:hypothetical protein
VLLASFVSMPSVPDVADGRGAWILVRLLWFLGGPFPRSPDVDEAVVRLLVVLSMAYKAGLIVEHFAGVLLPSPHLAVPATYPVYPGRFVGRFLALVSAWLLVFVVLLAAFVFLGAGMGVTGFSCNVLG